MLELARERAATLGLGNLRFVETDAETLAVEELGFNAAICRWGLMFVPDLDAVARRIARLLIRGGTFATAVWGPAERVSMVSVGDDVVRELAKLPPPQADTPHPLKLADPRPLERALSSAEFKEIHVEPIIVKFEFESAESLYGAAASDVGSVPSIVVKADSGYAEAATRCRDRGGEQAC
jgi:ubiquinone/menaquinone biosynthesis C-methylase UbiE